MRPMVTVAGKPLPEPAVGGYKSNTATFVDAGRNLDGITVGDVIRDDVAKVELNWAFLTVEQWSGILKLFDKKSGGNFHNPVTYFEQTSGTWETREMYVSDRSATTYLRDKRTGVPRGVVNARLSLVEM